MSESLGKERSETKCGTVGGSGGKPLREREREREREETSSGSTGTPHQPVTVYLPNFT
jgi:hypothetical protein